MTLTAFNSSKSALTFHFYISGFAHAFTFFFFSLAFFVIAFLLLPWARFLSAISSPAPDQGFDIIHGIGLLGLWWNRRQWNSNSLPIFAMPGVRSEQSKQLALHLLLNASVAIILSPSFSAYRVHCPTALQLWYTATSSSSSRESTLHRRAMISSNCSLINSNSLIGDSYSEEEAMIKLSFLRCSSYTHTLAIEGDGRQEMPSPGTAVERSWSYHIPSCGMLAR